MQVQVQVQVQSQCAVCSVLPATGEDLAVLLEKLNQKMSLLVMCFKTNSFKVYCKFGLTQFFLNPKMQNRICI